MTGIHTPGPLVYEVHPNEANRGAIGVPGGRWVASILHNGEALAERQLADGKLWAAAGELAELLDEGVKLMPLGTAKRARWIERAAKVLMAVQCEGVSHG